MKPTASGCVQKCLGRVGSHVQLIQVNSENQLPETLPFQMYLCHEPVNFNPTSLIDSPPPPASIRLCMCEYEASQPPHVDWKPATVSRLPAIISLSVFNRTRSLCAYLSLNESLRLRLIYWAHEKSLNVFYLTVNPKNCSCLSFNSRR